MNENKKMRDILKEIIQDKGYTMSDIADLLDRPLQTIRNKFSLDRFTFAEILLILDLCEYDINFTPKSKDDESPQYTIDIKSFYSDDELKRKNIVKENMIDREVSKIENIIKSTSKNVQSELVKSLEKKIIKRK